MNIWLEEVTFRLSASLRSSVKKEGPPPMPPQMEKRPRSTPAMPRPKRSNCVALQ